MPNLKRNLAILILTAICAVTLVGCNKENDPYKGMTAQQIYENGKRAALKKDYQQAIKDFDTLEARYPYGDYTDKGQLALIHAYANGEDEEAALAAADRFIRVHPRHPNVDYAYYMKGVVNYERNFSLAFRNMPLDRSMRDSTYAQHGFDDFKTLLEKFPKSRYNADARKRMIVLREQLADHELHIAEYYQNQGADLAAANRAGYLINQFPRTSSAKPALEILQQSYQDLGMKQEAQEVKDMLRWNFASN